MQGRLIPSLACNNQVTFGDNVVAFKTGLKCPALRLSEGMAQTNRKMDYCTNFVDWESMWLRDIRFYLVGILDTENCLVQKRTIIAEEKICSPEGVIST